MFEDASLTALGLVVVIVVLTLTKLYRTHLFLKTYPSDGFASFLLGHMLRTFDPDHGAAVHDYRVKILAKNNLIFLGRAPLSEIYPGFAFLMTADPRDCEHILGTNFENYVKGPIFRAVMQDLLGDGIFNTNGENWLVQRKAASHEFSVSRFRDFMTVTFLHHGEEFVDHLGTMCAQSESGAAMEVDMQKFFHKFTLQSIGEIGFGVDLGCLTKDVPFETSFDLATQLSAARFRDTLFWKAKRWFSANGIHISPREQTLQHSLQVIKDFANEIIHSRRELSHQDLDKKTDLLSRFMVLKTDDGKPYSDDFLRSVIINFILAGRDTTANCLSWLFYMLAKNPRVEELVRREITDHFGSGSNREQPTFDGLRVTNMPYLHATITETLRLYPSVPTDSKNCVKDDVLPSGTKVFAGWGVAYMPYAMGRMKQIWGEDAEEFRPERFLTELSSDHEQKWEFNKPSPFKFTAFQAGKRLCLGVDMAYLETKIAAVLLMQRNRFTLSKGFEECTYQRTLTLPMNRLKMDIVPLANE
eukprot:m.242111 g.242111  ORF g.242111 m.242111 type:complete len:529 (-) comp33789_c0_seq4:118-1704(-)